MELNIDNAKRVLWNTAPVHEVHLTHSDAKSESQKLVENKYESNMLNYMYLFLSMPKGLLNKSMLWWKLGSVH